MKLKSKDGTKWQIISHTVLMIFAICALVPFILLVSAPFSDETSVMTMGYSIIPHQCV